MNSSLKIIAILVASFTSVFASHSVAHSGGQDANGGHFNRKTGEYHCHAPRCFETHQKSDAAIIEAQKENRAFDYVYQREDWHHWIDQDGDCQNTRHEMLIEQADGPVKLSPDGCFVSSGVWDDPYSATRITRASELDVDHILPLKWVHTHGGSAWSKQKKEQFANDPLNLLVVDDGLNQEKGAQPPSQWMPPNLAFHCAYLHLWQKVLAKYSDLRMSESEQMDFNLKTKACQM